MSLYETLEGHRTKSWLSDSTSSAYTDIKIRSKIKNCSWTDISGQLRKARTLQNGISTMFRDENPVTGHIWLVLVTHWFH